MYDICYEYAQIIAGTSNRTSPVFMEVSKELENDTDKSLSYLKNFLVSIENIDGKTNDERISSTKGNIKKFSGYDNIKTVIGFLNKNLGGVDTVKDCVSVFNSLESYQSLYMEGYEKNCKFVILEYENALYLLVTTLSMIMANNMEVVSNGKEIKIQKRQATSYGVIPKTMKEMAKQLKDRNHKQYLEEILKATDNDGVKPIGEYTLMESEVGDAMAVANVIWDNLKKLGKSAKNMFRAVKNSLFGIIPLIRTVIYLRYKKKADTIASLEQQAAFIKNNIEQLKTIQTMDPKKKASIIKKQEAIVAAYMKKAEKLRAELSETEKQASVEIEKQNKDMKNDNDDFVLEWVTKFNEAENKELQDIAELNQEAMVV